MKTITTLFVLFLVQFVNAQVENTTTITVTIENLSTDKGMVTASLFTEETFLKANAGKSTSAKIINGKANLVFKDVSPGIYGITAFHDKNENNQMDFDPMGMPLEDYGISNNKFNPYGPPVWSDARFEVSEEPVDFNIRLSR